MIVADSAGQQSGIHARGWPRIARAEAAFLIAATSSMTSLHLVMFGMPMLNPDETTLFVMSLTLFGEPGSALHDLGARLGTHWGSFPAQFTLYIGALGAYASLPFHYAFGPSVEAVRSYNLFVALVLQLAIYATTRELFSKTPAMLATATFSALPFVIFFSRQSTMYDWIILPIALFVLYAGTRFVRGGSFWFLAAAVLAAWLIIWAYLYALWPVLGMIAALPFCVMSFRKRRPERSALAKAVLCAAVVGLAGFAPFAAQYATSQGGSWISFLIDTVNGDNANVTTDNSDVLFNLAVRLDHLQGVLTKPVYGLLGAFHVHTYWNPVNPAFAVLLAAGAAVAGMEVCRRRAGWGRFAGLFVVVATIIASSAFTVTSLNPMQLGVVLPFAFVLAGGGLGRATAWLAGTGRLKKAGLRQDHLAVAVIAVTVASQIPHVYEGFVDISEEPESEYMQAAGDLDAYLTDNGLTPIAMDWWTSKSLVLLLDGDPVPVAFVSRMWEKHQEFNQEIRDALQATESPVEIGENTAFVIYMYPAELDCSGDLRPSEMRSNQCAQAYLAESLADRAGLRADVVDFDLPDGTPYYRVLQMAPRA